MYLVYVVGFVDYRYNRESLPYKDKRFFGLGAFSNYGYAESFLDLMQKSMKDKKLFIKKITTFHNDVDYHGELLFLNLN